MTGRLKTLWAHEPSRVGLILTLAFLVRLAVILPLGNDISLPFRDQNTYYSLARALVDDGLLGVPSVPRGPYVEFREQHTRPPGFYPAFHDSLCAVWDSSGYLYGMVPWGKPNSFFEPLYPLLSAGMYLAFGDRFFWWRMVHVFLGVLLVWLVYDIGKRAFNPKVGALAALGVCFYPHFVFYSRILMAEALLLTTLALGFWAYFRLREKPHWGWAVALGASFSAFTLTRSFLIAFFPFMALFVGLFLKDKRRWGYAALALLAFALVQAPWIYRNSKLHDRLMLMSTRGGYNIWMRNNPYFIEDELAAEGVKFSAEKLDKLKYHEYILGYPEFTPEQGEIERNQILTDAGIRFITANPGFFLEMCWIRFQWTVGWRSPGLGPMLNLVALITYGPALLGFLVSLVWGWKRLGVVLPLWSVVGYFILFYSLTHEGTRYRVPVDPYMILLAVVSALWLYDRFTAGKAQHASRDTHA
ncbi:MAG: hypothetical protein C4524_03215 [Candidatus Zixiibacteriota bacterium]|nr:MAG: hypothetical protein C4524_03215 [candidate division Zixibacteria bacterium]